MQETLLFCIYCFDENKEVPTNGNIPCIYLKVVEDQGLQSKKKGSSFRIFVVKDIEGYQNNITMWDRSTQIEAAAGDVLCCRRVSVGAIKHESGKYNWYRSKRDSEVKVVDDPKIKESFASVTVENLWHSKIIGAIMGKVETPIVYLACPTCRKKVLNTESECPHTNCQSKFGAPKINFMVKLKIMDEETSEKYDIICFNDQLDIKPKSEDLNHIETELDKLSSIFQRVQVDYKKQDNGSLKAYRLKFLKDTE